MATRCQAIPVPVPPFVAAALMDCRNHDISPELLRAYPFGTYAVRIQECNQRKVISDGIGTGHTQRTAAEAAA